MRFFGMDVGSSYGVNPGRAYEQFIQLSSVVAYLLVYYHYTSLVGVLTFFGCLFSPFFLLAFGYAFWYYRTRYAPYQGGFRRRQLRFLRMWRHFRGFFPMHVHKTTELPSDKNYIFAMHPRGIINASKMAFVGTGATDFHFKFPDLQPHILTESVRFKFPLTREILLFTGISSEERRNMEYILNNRGHCQKKGQVCVVMLGEEDEVLRQRPEKFVLAIRSKKDFIRAALETGASIVPVLAFGENGIINVRPSDPGSCLRRFQEYVRSVLRIPFPIISSRDIAKHAFGFLPLRLRIDVVVGKPIEVQKVPHATEQQTQQLFEAYIKEVEALFNEQKSKYFENPNIALSIE